MVVSTRFGELYDDLLSELISLKQDNDLVEVNLEMFENAMNRLTLPEAHALCIFLSNMSPHLVMNTRKFEVNTIIAVARTAKLH